jgi:transcriptional regulator with XRE-family HTH domain
VHRGVTQSQLAEAVGLSVATYRRLERGELRNPPIGYLVNCAIALGCTLDDLLNAPLLEWATLDESASSAPDRYKLWKSPRSTWQTRPENGDATSAASPVICSTPILSSSG